MKRALLLRQLGLLAFLLASIAWPEARADEGDKSPARLTLPRVFASGEFGGERFGPSKWLTHRNGYTTLEAGDEGRDIVWYDPATGKREILVPAHHLVPPGESSPLRIDAYHWSASGAKLLIFTNSKRVWRANTRGDYWVVDINGGELMKIGGEAQPSSCMFAKFSPDGSRVAYVRENNIYVQDLLSKQITALTSDGAETLINGTFDWVYEEEFRLRDGFRWSPDGQSIAYWQIDSSQVPTFSLINNTDSLYPTIQPIPYPKVGQKNPSCRVGVVSVSGGETCWLKIPGDPANHYLAGMQWAPASPSAPTTPAILVQQLNRLQNTNVVFSANPTTGAATTVVEEKDDAWVDVESDVQWLDEGRSFLWISERDGWRHAYVVSLATAQTRLITPGNHDLISPAGIDEASGGFYYLASPENATQCYLYRAALDGSGGQRVTPQDQPGWHGYDLSPDGQWAIHTYSTFDTPPVTDLVRLPAHESIRVLASNEKLIAKLKPIERSPSEFFRVDIGEGVELDAWCVKPPDFDPRKKYPVLFHVYGEPAGQTVLDRWGGRAQLWRLLLAQQGYLVMSVDNRGTPAPRGRQWRKIVYRRIGVLASADQAAAVRAILKSRPYVDAARVGVWGWSGGGSMTLNAMFRYSDLYTTGMSVAPVPNQRLYDTIYQERYMGLPDENVEGYRLGSPINFAKQLKGNLLLVHGTGDDNVHYQGMEMLINELIAYNKPFTMMAYPNRSHGISEGKNTTLHLYELLTRYLRQHLPPGPK